MPANVFRLCRLGLNEVSLESVGTLNSRAFDEGVTSVTSVEDGNGVLVASYRRSEGLLRLLRATPELPLATDFVDLPIGDSYDQVSTFQIGNQPHALCYQKDTGSLHFFAIDGGKLSTRPYIYARLHEPGMTKGMSMLSTFVCRGLVWYLAYDIDDGRVGLYSLQVTANSEDGVPPLIGHMVWSAFWSPGWTRFFLFRMGGANFFLKTNIRRLNVNIDHIQDDPSQGTFEVANHLEKQLPDAASIVALCGFYLEHGEPYFAAVDPAGSLTIYRIHADCKGWTPVAKKMLGAAVQMGTYCLAGTTYFFTY